MIDPDNWLSFESAPADVVLWMVHGSEFSPSLMAVRIRDYPDSSRAVWGYSVYRRQPGFRTLGVGSSWTDEHSARFFVLQAEALAHLGKLTTPLCK